MNISEFKTDAKGSIIEIPEKYSHLYSKHLKMIAVVAEQDPESVHVTEICPEDYGNYSFYFEAKTFLQGLSLVEDKLSMVRSLECHVPFMDNDLADFAIRMSV